MAYFKKNSVLNEIINNCPLSPIKNNFTHANLFLLVFLDLPAIGWYAGSRLFDFIADGVTVSHILPGMGLAAHPGNSRQIISYCTLLTNSR